MRIVRLFSVLLISGALGACQGALDTPEEVSSELGVCGVAIPVDVTASGDDGNVPSNVLDGSLSTRWSSLGLGQNITLDLGATKTVCGLAIAWYQGNTRVNRFSIALSTDGKAFTTVLAAKSSGTRSSLETVDFADAPARYIRVTVHGNTANEWASLTEIRTWAAENATTGESLFGGTLPPSGDQIVSDRAAVELGVQFQTKVTGSVNAIRIYRARASTAPVAVSLWDKAGAMMGTGTGGSGASGWVTVPLRAPVMLTANTTYVASYFAPAGAYAATNNGFSSGVTRGNLSAPSKAGVYRYGATGFPTQVYQSSNYWVDVTFVAGSQEPQPTSPSPQPSPSPEEPQPPSPPSPSSSFPNATNTGLVQGTVLTRKMGSVTLNTPGQVLENVEVNGCITLSSGAHNVTIRNVLVRSAGCFWLILNDAGATNLQVVDSELDGMGNTSGDAAIAGRNYTLTRVNIHGTVDGAKLGSNTTIQDSYIHDLVVSSGSHNDGLQALDATNLNIRHNTLIVPSGSTSAIIFSQNSGSGWELRDVWIDSNLLGGGAFTIYGGYQAGTDNPNIASNINITNNHFTTVVYPRSGAFGPMTSVDAPVVKLSGNVWADGPNAGKPVN